MLNTTLEKVLFIINPISGSGSRRNVEGVITKRLDAVQFMPHFVYTTRPGDASNIARNAVADGVRWIVAVGGDGTVNEVARELVSTPAALGIIPRGSGNGMARHLGIPVNVDRATGVLNHGRIAMVDYGTLNDTPFFCTAGIGFDAHVGDKFSRIGGRGFTNYLKTTIVEYINYRPTEYKIWVNGKLIQKEAFLITVANASQWGNNAFIAPEADMQDGLLNVTIISPFPKYMAPTIGLKLFSKRIGTSKYVESFKVSDILIERPSPDCVHFDGEPTIMGERLQVGIMPQALKVFVP
ncbi:MAG: YegS/Rv2252/BmrU family lipid kinase [Bacteroidales bacterium]|nr:YegS/Rv2252/BmrU family lipid kinase [Bacteroidales bacterium]